MKVLIWILCIVVPSAIVTALSMNGILLGAVPSTLIYGGALALAWFLCKKWDERI